MPHVSTQTVFVRFLRLATYSEDDGLLQRVPGAKEGDS
jgi:hypothetical protein